MIIASTIASPATYRYNLPMPETYSTHTPTTMTTEMQRADRYYNWIYSALQKDLPVHGTILEIGFGHGNLTARLASNKDCSVVATERDETYLQSGQNRFSGHPRVQIRRMDGIEPAALQDRVSAVVAVNVMEHIADDAHFIQSARRVLQDRGRLLLLVPAFTRLYANMDREAGHYRRYQKKALAVMLTEQGFQLIRLHYFNFIGFFGWLGNKVMRTPLNNASSQFQVRVFNVFIPVIQLFDIFTFLCGQSLIAVAEKRPAQPDKEG